MRLDALRLRSHRLAFPPLRLPGRLVTDDLLERPDLLRLATLVRLVVALGDELGQRQLQPRIALVGKLAELPGVQPQLARHLQRGVRQTESLPCLEPGL